MSLPVFRSFRTARRGAKVFELDAREQGSFQHEVLKIFHEQLSAEGKRWRDLTPPDARKRVGEIAALLALDYRDGLCTPASKAGSPRAC